MNHARSSLHGDVPPVMSHDHERRGKSGCEPSNLGISPNSLETLDQAIFGMISLSDFAKTSALRFRMKNRALKQAETMRYSCDNLDWSFAHLEFSLGPHAYTLLTESKISGVSGGLFPLFLIASRLPSKRNAWVVASLPKTNISRLTSPY